MTLNELIDILWEENKSYYSKAISKRQFESVIRGYFKMIDHKLKHKKSFSIKNIVEVVYIKEKKKVKVDKEAKYISNQKAMAFFKTFIDDIFPD
jgi:hypothetical protein